MLPSTLTLYPIPNESVTATVYYFPRVPESVYTTTIGDLDFPIEDEFITPTVQLAIANLFERVGDEKRAMYYRQLYKESLTEAQATFPRNDGVSEITYHTSVEGD